ncbi:M50 family metallopeptidase [Roseivirga sp.]|uniref:M50 family metallopeptidase n=1 Tax=Roseivirga sp. TaxID=1964215 RepID=UPI003B8E764E
MKLKENQKQHLILVLLILAAMFMWNTPLVYPIKLFVVMLHEMSHGIMAEVFGGDIVNIQIDYRIGGYCKYTVPSSFFAQIMIASAGYLGSLFWGLMIILAAVRTKKDKYISLTIGLVLLVLSWFVIKTGETFGIIVTIGFSLFMLLSFRFLSNKFHDYFLKFIGLISCLYVVLDIKNDLIDRRGVGSDADAISEMIGVPAVAIGVFWLVLALVAIFYTLKYAYRKANS